MISEKHRRFRGSDAPPRSQIRMKDTFGLHRLGGGNNPAGWWHLWHPASTLYVIPKEETCGNSVQGSSPECRRRTVIPPFSITCKQYPWPLAMDRRATAAPSPASDPH